MLCHSRVKLSQIDSGDRFWQTRVKCYYERSCTGRGYSANCRTQRQQMQLSTARVNVKSILICHDCKSEMKELIWYHIWAFGCVTTAVLTCPNWRKGKSFTFHKKFFLSHGKSWCTKGAKQGLAIKVALISKTVEYFQRSIRMHVLIS